MINELLPYSIPKSQLSVHTCIMILLFQFSILYSILYVAVCGACV